MSPFQRLVAAVASLALLLPSAAAASTWEATATVAPPPAGPTTAALPVVAADAAGNLTGVWVGLGTAGVGVYTATRGAGPATSWSAATRLAPTTGEIADLRLSVNSSGQAVAGWIDPVSDTEDAIVTMTRTAAGVWSAPTRLTPGVLVRSHQLVADPAGQATGLWSALSDAAEEFGGITQTAGGLPALGAGPAQTVSTENGGAQLALDAAGNATSLFIDQSGTKLRVAVRPAGGGWQPSVLLDDWAPADDEFGAIASPKLAVNGSGQAVATWVRRSDTGGALYAASRSATGSWSAPKVIDSLDPDADGGERYIPNLVAGIDAAGRAIVGWSLLYVIPDPNVTHTAPYWTEVRSSQRRADGTWTAPEARSVRGEGTFNGTDFNGLTFRNLDLAVSPNGSAAVTWVTGADTTRRIEAAAFDAGSWDATFEVAKIPRTADSIAPMTSIAIDPTGRGTVAWIDYSSVKSRSVVLAAPPADPKPADPTPADPTPSGQSPTSGGGTPSGTSTPTPVNVPAVQPKLVVTMYVIPNGHRCPARAVATVSKVRTALTVKASKIRGKLRCKATGTILLPFGTKPGTKVSVLVTAKGVKRKTIVVAATI